MALHFSPVIVPLHNLKIWHAASDEYLFAISHRIHSEPKLRDDPGFVAA